MKKILLVSLSLLSLFFGEVALAATQNFTAIADLHFDPFITCNSRPCSLIKKLQAAPASQWPSIFSDNDDSSIQYGKDSNYLLLESSLEKAKNESQEAHAEFVLVIGDFLAHDYDLKYRRYSGDKTKAGYLAFVKKTLTFLTAEFKRSFPHTDVYFAVGNNDSYQTDYTCEPGGSFYKDVAALSATLVNTPANKADLLREFPRGGYYAVTAPHQPQLKLLVLNSVLFSRKAKGKEIDAAAQAELAWLHQELAQAGQKKQSVLIAMHIPLGIDVYTAFFNTLHLVEFWRKAYSEAFLKELAAYSPEIMGVFPAHIHTDSFQMLKMDKGSIPVTGTQAISPIFGNNPAFKVYTYSVPGLRLTDFVTYYYSLNADRQWKREHDVEEVAHLSADS